MLLRASWANKRLVKIVPIFNRDRRVLALILCPLGVQVLCTLGTGADTTARQLLRFVQQLVGSRQLGQKRVVRQTA